LLNSKEEKDFCANIYVVYQKKMLEDTLSSILFSDENILKKKKKIVSLMFYIVVLTFAIEQGGRAAAYLPKLRDIDATYGTPLRLKKKILLSFTTS